VAITKSRRVHIVRDRDPRSPSEDGSVVSRIAVFINPGV